jgi:hypothetical protein
MAQVNTVEGEKVSTKLKGKSESETLAYIQELYDDDKNWRGTLVDKEWMLNSAYYRGMHNVKYDVNRKKIVASDDDPLKFYINLVLMAVRTVRSAILRNSPVWDIDGIPFGSVKPDDSRILNEFMVALFEKLGLKTTLKEMVMYGLLYSIGILEYGFDGKADDGEGELWVEARDPFDVYFGGRATTGIDDAERVTFVTMRTLSQLKELEKEGKYKNVKAVSADNKVSDSSYKTMLTDAEGLGNSLGASLSDGDTVLVRHTWIMVGGKVVQVNWTDNVVLSVVETTFKKFPIVIWNPDINPGEIYNEGWVKPLLPLNRSINYLERKILAHNVTMATGKYITDQDSGVKHVTNASGEIIKVRTGARFEQMRVSPMSNTPFNQLGNLNRYFQDISGIQEALLGRAPTGVTAGVAFEELVANALANLGDLVDNLVTTLEDLGTDLLDLGYENYTVTKPFKVRKSTGGFEVLRVGGKDASIGKDDDTAVRLPEKAVVRVKISSGLANTKQGKQQTLLSLRAGGDLSQQTLLEEFGFDATEEQTKIMKEAQGMPLSIEEALAEEDGGMEQMDEGVEDVGQAQAPEAVGSSDEELAQELLMQLDGAGIIVPEDILADVALLAAIARQEVQVEEIDGVLTIVQ